MKRKITSLLLAVTVLFGCAQRVFADETPTAPEEDTLLRQTVTIQTAEDFLLFAKNCQLDTWSQDKEVLLTADISLAGTGFVCVPTFGGVFRGNGHTIQGLNLDGSVNPAGLFSQLQATAVVQELNVSGTVTPDADATIVGGIVGTNRGTLENCTFTGTVEGNAATGGICGINYGTLRNCRSYGTLMGKNRTGGIVGDNQATVEGCENHMAVNTTSVDPTIDPTRIDLDFNLDLDQLSRLDTRSSATDTGGIAGYSCGTVSDCVNCADIGYPSIGYNLGGILGRNTGFVDACRNEGHIQGRKDVGGIVGQMEPNITQILSPDYLQTLSDQFEHLGDLVSAAGGHASSAGGEIQSAIQTISAYGSSARSALDSFSSELKDSLTGGSFPPSTDSLHTVAGSIQGMVNATNALKDALSGSVGTMSDDVSAISGQISSISKTFSLATEDARQELVTDVSDETLLQIQEGKVLSCTNTGTVEADVNTGGIAGMMGLEYTLDPEDDTLGGSSLRLKHYELKAVIQNCKNLGTVTGKRSYVGGICGRMALGTIAACEGYGTISSTGGNYVGGIAGITAGSVRDCFAKCTLTGQDYLGGIVGSGTVQDVSGESSTVSGCYSMVDIPEYTQYIGAISGSDSGSYLGNYFFSDTLAGINFVSYTALAEPISYEALLRVESLPQHLRDLTLHFVADGETLKSLPFSFGDSFDSSVYPQLPEKAGYYARWDTTDLTNLHFDTVVTAQYYPLITALNSTDVRSNGNPVLFVQGRFQEGDALLLSPGTSSYTPGNGQQLLEQWHVSIPADGLDTHTIRYLSPDTDTDIYLLKNGLWNRVSTEEMGSYLAFSASGAEVEFVAVSHHVNGYYLVLLVATLLLLLMLLLLLRRKKPRSRKLPSKKVFLVVLTVPVLAAAVFLALRLLPQTRKAVDTLHACDILTAYAAQPEQSMSLEVTAKLADQEISFTADIHRTCSGDTPVTVIDQSGRTLYYADGVVFLSDGSAYRLSSDVPDYSRLLEPLTRLYGQVEVEAVDGIYTLTASDATATELLELLLPAAHSLLTDANRLTVDLVTQEQRLIQIHFTGAGVLADSVQTPFSVSAQLTVATPSVPDIPQAVAQALSTGDYQAQNTYSDDLVRLVALWRTWSVKPAAGANVTVQADCGPLQLSEDFQFYRWKVEDTVIQGIRKQDATLYFTDTALCDAQGRTLRTGTEDTMDVDAILDLVFENFRNLSYRCEQTSDGSLYTVTLNEAGMQSLMTTVLPQSADWDIHYTKGDVRLLLEGDSLQSICLTCGGSASLTLLDVAVSLNVELTPLDDGRVPDLPEAVTAKLAPASP